MVENLPKKITLTSFFKMFLVTCLAGLLLIAVWGCQVGGGTGSDPATAGGEVRLKVTENFGQEVIFDEKVEAAPGEAVSSLLNSHLEVEFAHGGGFVNSIEGVKSAYSGIGAGSEKKDWFHYVNGILTEAAVDSIYLEEGDVIWWDYHSWDEVLYVPAVTGAFPQPFVNGYRQENPGTAIMHGDGALPSAEKMADFLKEEGAADPEPELLPYNEENVRERSRITMVVATWEEIAGSELWEDLQENRAQTGLFVEIQDQGVIPLDGTGAKLPETPPFEGAVLATGSGMGDSSPLWLLAARDEEQLERLADAVISSPRALDAKAGAVWDGEEFLRVPVDQAEAFDQAGRE